MLAEAQTEGAREQRLARNRDAYRRRKEREAQTAAAARPGEGDTRASMVPAVLKSLLSVSASYPPLSFNLFIVMLTSYNYCHCYYLPHFMSVALQSLGHKQIQHLPALLCLCHPGIGPTTFLHKSHHNKDLAQTPQVFGLPLCYYYYAFCSGRKSVLRAVDTLQLHITSCVSSFLQSRLLTLFRLLPV